MIATLGGAIGLKKMAQKMPSYGADTEESALPASHDWADEAASMPTASEMPMAAMSGNESKKRLPYGSYESLPVPYQNIH